jgi:SNF2 family DNA or RNA helicase
MGLGKTVQIIGLLAAIQKKAGTDKDLQKIKQNRIRIGQAIRDKDAQSEDALLLGTTRAGSVSSKLLRIEKEALTTGRIMIVVPPSVIANWQNELDEWGHFGVAVYQDKGRDTALDRVRIGIDEILICGKSLFSRKDSFEALNAIKWRLIVIDEFHEYKNKRARSYECVKQIRAASSCPIVGLTGTLMQNSYDELWALVSLVQPGLLGEFDEFQDGLAKPLMYARSKTATGGTLDVGEKRQQELTRVLKLVFLERKKEQVLKDTLTQKDEVVVFCEMTSIQKRIYLNVLELPDVRLLKEAHAPCDCGVNQWFFIVYNKLKTKKERLEYARRNKEHLVGKKECCHQYPLTDFDPPTIHPDAILWKSIDRHSSDSTHSELCKQCPWCVLLPALNKLYKVCSHASLLQADQDPGQLAEGSAEWKKVTKTVDFAKIVLTPDILQDLPGQSYVRKDGIMNEHIELSGKMKYLDYLLDKYSKVRDRVLIFSYSTKTLDLIQHYVQSMGYSYLRLDGSTPNKKRQGLVDQFQNDPTIFLFLISTKAGGLGLNLTSANKVIVFDVNWNPSYDEQAQDRAFRIGQNRDVKVVRLVAQGTIEEHMYMRQLYKVHLKQQALGDKDETLQAARIFRGVVGDKNRKGELFGTENLLNYKDGSFMLDVWKSSGRTIASSGSGSPQMHCTEDVSNALNMLTELQLEDCFERHCDEDALLAQDGRDSTDTAVGKEGFHHQDFLRSDRGGAAIEEGDEGFEEEMGGASQMIHVEATRYCEAVDNCGKDGIDADDEAISMQEDQEEKMEKAPKVEDETLGQEIKDEENNSTSSVINPQGDESQNQEGEDGEDNVRPGKASTVQGTFEVKERSGAVAGASAAMPESLSTGELDGTKYAHVMILAEAKKNGLQMGRSLRNLLYRPKYRK